MLELTNTLTHSGHHLKMQSCTIALFELVKVTIGAAALVSIWVAYRAYRANLQKQQEDRVRDAD